MANNIEEILLHAAQVRDETNEAANTALRVGTVLVELGDFIRRWDGVQSEAVAELIRPVTEELLRRIMGVSEKSNAETDPMRNLGAFESWAALTEKLDAIFPTQTTNHEFNGMLRFHVSGLQLHAFQFPREWAREDCIQVLNGPVSVDRTGTTLAGSSAYRTLWRRHTQSSGWTPWEEYGSGGIIIE